MARLSRELFVEEALGLIDEQGLAALTARRLAQRVGADPGALYHYLKDMDELVEEVLARVISPASKIELNGDSWQDGALARARVFRAGLLAHPNIIPVLSGPLGRRVIARIYETWAAEADELLGMMAADGIVGEAALQVIEVLEAFSIGSATIGSPHLATGAALGAGPRLRELLTRHDWNPGRRFEDSLRTLLDALAASARPDGARRNVAATTKSGRRANRPSG